MTTDNTDTEIPEPVMQLGKIISTARVLTAYAFEIEARAILTDGFDEAEIEQANQWAAALGLTHHDALSLALLARDERVGIEGTPIGDDGQAAT